jgi:hypothetical protein
MIASVTFPLAVSIVMTQTPLPVILARFAWYGYSGNGALNAMAWAVGNDNEVTTMELDASARAAEVGRFFPRVFFSTGVDGVAGSTEGGVWSFAGAGF